MAKALYTTPIGAPTGFAVTVLNEIDTTVDAYSRNLRDGPTTLFTAAITNDDATEIDHVKLYNNITSALVSGTTAPDIILPVPADATGTLIMQCHEGVPFSNGISVLCAKEAGNLNTNDPTGTPDGYIITSG